MADIVSKQKRSEMMAGIRGTNTKPELMIRSILHRLGFRYIIHATKLPGRPDMVFPKHKAVVFVHGCFWHLHDCHLFKMPSSRKEFWITKLSGNVDRDGRTLEKLRALGWRIAVIWECALKGRTKIPVEAVASKCANWLLSKRKFLEIKGI